MSELYVLQNEVKELQNTIAMLNRNLDRERNLRVELSNQLISTRNHLRAAFGRDNWADDEVTLSTQVVKNICKAIGMSLTKEVEVDVTIEGTVTVTIPLWEDEDDAKEQLTIDSDGAICTNDGNHEVSVVELDFSN